MKLGRKGFMLAEVVVVAVVIATVLVTLFTGLNNVSSAYETRNRYYDVDSLYVAMEINDILLRTIGTLSDHIINFSGRVYGNISQDLDIDIQDFGMFYRDKTGDTVVSYISPYVSDKILSLSNFNNDVFEDETSATFNDYIEYLSGNLDFEADYDYIIIVERRENGNIDDCYYYALKLKC